MVYRGSQVGPMFGLRREIDRLFEDTFGRDTARGGGWVPPVDVRDRIVASFFSAPGDAVRCFRADNTI